MSAYEILTLLVSLIAVFVSLLSLARTRKLGYQQLELEKKTAALSEKQLEMLEAEEQAKSVAEIDVELEGYGSDYRFLITNIGGSEARDVHFSIDGEGYPLVASQYAEKIPIPVLSPGKSVELLAPKTMGCASSYETRVHWLNPDGTQGRNQIVVHW